MTILLIAEHDNQQLKHVTHHTLTAAQTIGGDIHLLVMGSHCQSVVEEARSLPGVTKVLAADHEHYAHQLAENGAALIATMGKHYEYILAPASTFGKNLLPRAAALLDMAMIGDVTLILSSDTFVRPIFAGNAIATVQTQDPIKLLTIRTTAFAAAKALAAPAATVETIATDIPATTTRFEQQSLTQSSRPELTSARIIISGGRGLKSADNFHLLEKLADRLGAAVGASRAAVDAGFAPNDYQVGQTGKIVAPDLYIAVGISGAIQHLAGMKDSKVIVAINNDPEAPIFQVADYGLVGDLFTLVPEISSELDRV